MENLITEKQCPMCQTVKKIKEFMRLSQKEKIRVHRVCNDCCDTQNGRYKAITQIADRPKVKPVWMVVYSSYP